MDPLTVGLALGGVSALSGGIQGLMDRSTAKKQARAYNDAIALMQQQAAKQYSGLYGANATANSMSTGDAYQDMLLRELAQAVQEKEIQAAALNASRPIQTDLDAQREALLQLLAHENYQNRQALANASITARRTGMGNAGGLLWQANRANAAGRNNAANTARLATQNNLARIGAGTNLNTGSIADQNRQMAQNLYANANQNYNAALNNLTNMYTNQNAAKAKTPSYLGTLGSSLMSGALVGGTGYYLAGLGNRGPQPPNTNTQPQWNAPTIDSPTKINSVLNF